MPIILHVPPCPTRSAVSRSARFLERQDARCCHNWHLALVIWTKHRGWSEHLCRYPMHLIVKVINSKKHQNLGMEAGVPLCLEKKIKWCQWKNTTRSQSYSHTAHHCTLSMVGTWSGVFSGSVDVGDSNIFPWGLTVGSWSWSHCQFCHQALSSLFVFCVMILSSCWVTVSS